MQLQRKTKTNAMTVENIDIAQKGEIAGGAAPRQSVRKNSA